MPGVVKLGDVKLFTNNATIVSQRLGAIHLFVSQILGAIHLFVSQILRAIHLIIFLLASASTSELVLGVLQDA